MFVPISTESNLVVSNTLTTFLDYFMIIEDEVVLLTSQVTWVFSLDNFDLYVNFLKNLLTLEEIELLFKTFKEFETLNDFSNINMEIRDIYSSLNYKTDYINSLVDYFLLDLSTNNFSKLDENCWPTNEFFIQIWNFISNQLSLIESVEILFRKKIINFYFYNFFFIGILSLTILILNQSTNLIYTLLSFLSFAIISGLIIIFWGSEYIGLCVLLIYGAAIPVLALYIIMLVNVDLIQWLFFIESVKNFTLKKQFNYVLISFACACSIFFLNSTDVTFELSSKIFFLKILIKNLFFLMLIRRYLNLIDTSYGLVLPSEIPLNFNNTDIDKVASAAFKLSFNELFALVLLLLVAIIVVISISRPSNITSKIISYERYTINQPLYTYLLNQSLKKEGIIFWVSLILTALSLIWEPFVGFMPYEYWFYWTLHLFFQVHSMGEIPYRKVMYLIEPWRKEKKN